MSDNLSTTHARPSLRGQRIVIIGGCSGIGYAAADCALAEGAQVRIASNNGARVETALARLGRSALGGIVDVRAEASIAHFFGGLPAFDHLIYMVGDTGPHLLSASLTQRDSASAAEALNVNYWGALMAIKHARRGCLQAVRSPSPRESWRIGHRLGQGQRVRTHDPQPRDGFGADQGERRPLGLYGH